MLISVSKFFPAGTQLASPGGLHFDPTEVTAVEAKGEPDGYLRIILRSGADIRLMFHRNVDDGPVDIYEIKNNILRAVQQPVVKPGEDELIAFGKFIEKMTKNSVHDHDEGIMWHPRGSMEDRLAAFRATQRTVTERNDK